MGDIFKVEPSVFKIEICWFFYRPIRWGRTSPYNLLFLIPANLHIGRLAVVVQELTALYDLTTAPLITFTLEASSQPKGMVVNACLDSISRLVLSALKVENILGLNKSAGSFCIKSWEYYEILNSWHNCIHIGNNLPIWISNYCYKLREMVLYEWTYDHRHHHHY